MKIKQVEGLQAELGNIVQNVEDERAYYPTGSATTGEILVADSGDNNYIVGSGRVFGTGLPASATKIWPSSEFGDAARKNVGTTAGTVCAGDDSRLGGTPANPADDSVTYAKLNSTLKQRSAVSASAIDWSAAAIFTKTLGANTTFTFSNLQLNKVITLLVSGNYTVTLPTYCKRISGTYSGTAANYIQFHCVNISEGSEEVWYTINQQAV